MNASIAWLWLQVLNLICTAAIGVWRYIDHKNDKTNERINDLAARHEELDKTLREVKSASGHSLRHDDLSKVYGRLNEMDGKLNQLVGEFRGSNDTLRLLLNRITEKGLK